MIGDFLRTRRKKRVRYEIDPDEVLIDSSNLPLFDREKFEGQIESPISKKRIYSVFAIFIIIAVVFSGKLWILQIKNGKAYALQSENNRLHQSLVFAERGLIVDRNGEMLVWNEPRDDNPIPIRSYIDTPGFAHILGYVSYPKKDSAGYFYQENFEGKEGVEQIYNNILMGENGLKLTETNAKGDVESESTVLMPKNGQKLFLSIDKRVNESMNKQIRLLAERANFSGGAGVMMDVKTGEIIALTSFPEFDSEAVSLGDKDVFLKYKEDKKTPFLNRVVSGTYTPGSIVKLFVAIGALSENIVDPNKNFYSSGKIEVPNPYNKEQKSVFVDWKAHGYVDMSRALAVSSNVYFYIVGGGFEGQKGLGITNIEKYMRLFGFGNLTGIEFAGEKEGTVPNPTWKAEMFDGDDWRLGDTFHTAIGQYGFQVTPIQAVRAVAAIANDGKLMRPLLVKVNSESEASPKWSDIPISPTHFKVVREGMKRAVEEGTARAMSMTDLQIGAKTGTAEIGLSKKYVNSWAIGFFPYDDPKYAFALLMEHGPRTNTIGAAAAMRGVFDDLKNVAPEYFGSVTETDTTPIEREEIQEIEIGTSSVVESTQN